MIVIEFYNLDELLQLADLKQAFVVTNSTNLIDSAGLPYVLEIITIAKSKIGDFLFVLDCGANQACVMEGIQLGLKHIIFTGNEILLKKLRDIASNVECEILRNIHDKFK